MFVLDTNVVSELRKARSRKIDPRVAAWQGAVPASAMFVSVITIEELEIGVLRAEKREPKQGAVLRTWIEEHVLPSFAGRILPIDIDVALRCARLHVPDPRNDRDALIAATALVHGMTVATRNVRDFAGTGVALVDPWA